MRSLAVLLASLVTIPACGGSHLLGPELIQRLTVFGGCADIVFYAVDGEDELMLTFRAEGVISEARAAGGAQESVMTFVLPAPATELILQQGTRISDATCDDVIENGGPQVGRSWTATAGTVTVSVRPDPIEETARADLLMEHVVLEGSGGHQVAFDRLVWTEILVGWYAG